MRRVAMTIVTLFLVSQPAASSARLFNFDAIETSALSPTPTRFTFSLNTATALNPGGSTTFSDVAIIQNGSPVPANTVFAQYGTSLGSPLFYFVDTGPSPFSSGSGSGIAFNAGTFMIADGATDGEGTLRISTVPEPYTWALMIAGVVMTGVMLRSRRRSGLTHAACPG